MASFCYSSLLTEDPPFLEICILEENLFIPTHAAYCGWKGLQMARIWPVEALCLALSSSPNNKDFFYTTYHPSGEGEYYAKSALHSISVCGHGPLNLLPFDNNSLPNV